MYRGKAPKKKNILVQKLHIVLFGSYFSDILSSYIKNTNSYMILHMRTKSFVPCCHTFTYLSHFLIFFKSYFIVPFSSQLRCFILLDLLNYVFWFIFLCFYFFFDVLFTFLLKKNLLVFWDILCFEIVEIVFYSISPCYLTLFKNGHLFFLLLHRPFQIWGINY